MPGQHAPHLREHSVGHVGGLEDRGVFLGEQFFAGSLGPDLAAVHDGHAIAEILHIAEQVGTEEHGLAAAGEGRDQILNLP